jgi:hypothetical protein
MSNRKHDNILTTEEESDDEDLVNMDLKNYISDEDPDYALSTLLVNSLSTCSPYVDS